jgi:hypothetical protein
MAFNSRFNALRAAFSRSHGMMILSGGKKRTMDIEDTVNRQSYRGFHLLQLRRGSAPETRWYITQRDCGMDRSYGFAVSIIEARSRVDDLLK